MTQDMPEAIYVRKGKHGKYDATDYTTVQTRTKYIRAGVAESNTKEQCDILGRALSNANKANDRLSKRVEAQQEALAAARKAFKLREETEKANFLHGTIGEKDKRKALRGCRRAEREAIRLIDALTQEGQTMDDLEQEYEFYLESCLCDQAMPYPFNEWKLWREGK